MWEREQEWIRFFTSFVGQACARLLTKGGLVFLKKSKQLSLLRTCVDCSAGVNEAVAGRLSGGVPSRSWFPLLVEPTESIQFETVLIIERDAFPLQQPALQGIAAVARQGEGHLALGVDDAMPGDFYCWIEVLKHVAHKAGAARQTRHRSDLAIGCYPAFGDAPDDGANRREGCIACGQGRRVSRAR